MPTPKKRRSKKATKGRARSAARAPRGAQSWTFDSFVDDIIRSASGLDADEHLEVEVFASVTLALLDADPNGRPAERLGRARELIDRLAARTEPAALAILLGLAALLPEPESSIARAAASRLRNAGVAAPAWPETIGQATFLEAWAATDSFGDQDMIVASFAHPGERPHSFRITADHNFRGLFRQAAVDLEPEIVRRVWDEVSDMPLVQITAADLARRWAAGTGMYRTYLDAPVYDEVPRIMPLLEARARALPTPAEPAEDDELSDEDRRAFIGAFLTSPHAGAIGHGSDVDVELVVDTLVDFRDGHGEGDLDRWSPIVVEIAMLDWLPRKATLAPDETAALPAVLRALVRFSGTRKGLSDGDIAETITAIDSFEAEYFASMADNESFGPGKRIALAMQGDGVDFDDLEAVRRWIDAFNEGSIEGRDDVLGPLPPAP